ncbi:MAG: hypothetical protein KC621_32960 [Myxococcales bacterium]|nr:hypothetical protein [Myxococcales bacterium]
MRSLGYALRQRIRWSTPPLKWTMGPEAALAALPERARTRAAVLMNLYDTERWSGCCGTTDWVESLYTLDLLDRWAPKRLPEGRCLDVGSKNGAYLPALATAVPRGWDAVEIDAHRRYLDGSTRRAHGERMASCFEACRFHAGDVRELDGPWALVTWFLPFLSQAPLAAWGLPDELLAPRELLRHVTERVAPGGTLLLVNQGEQELRLQHGLFLDLGLEPTLLGKVCSALSPYRQTRFAWSWTKPLEHG